jgi:hypothetical protein
MPCQQNPNYMAERQLIGNLSGAGGKDAGLWRQIGRRARRGEELREAGDGEVAGAIADEQGTEKAQRDKDKLELANEKE